MTINLSILRKTVQISFFLFLVYGSSIVGFYAADKISGNLPALACAYDATTADYCALIPFQHQMDHRVGGWLTGGGPWIPALLPTLTTLGSFLLMFVVLNKAFCGWICPLGTFQELIHGLSTKLGIVPQGSVQEGTVKKTRPWKWLLLGGLVFALPLLTGMGITPHELGSPFCTICPSRFMTTLMGGDFDQLAVATATPLGFALSLTGVALFSGMAALSLGIKQPFCRICPMLALHAIFKRFGLLRLVKTATPRCAKCNLCARACPMDIREIAPAGVAAAGQAVADNAAQEGAVKAVSTKPLHITHADCTLCGRCVEFCPDRGVMALKYAGMPVFVSSPTYFKGRKGWQKGWENRSLLGWWRGRK